MPGSIDPASVFTENKAYLVYGGGYTWLAELDRETGLQINEDWFDSRVANLTLLILVAF